MVREPGLVQQALMLADAPTTLLDVRGAKPWEALCRLRDTLPANSVDRKA